MFNVCKPLYFMLTDTGVVPVVWTWDGEISGWSTVKLLPRILHQKPLWFIKHHTQTDGSTGILFVITDASHVYAAVMNFKECTYLQFWMKIYLYVSFWLNYIEVQMNTGWMPVLNRQSYWSSQGLTYIVQAQKSWLNSCSNVFMIDQIVTCVLNINHWMTGIIGHSYVRIYKYYHSTKQERIRKNGWLE